MAPSNPVRIVDANGNPITEQNPLPTTASLEGGGDASAANQQTMITHLSQIEAAAETVAGAVDGTDVQVDVQTVKLPSAVYNGVQAVASAGTAEALGSSQALTSGVTVKAFAGNQGNIYVGNSSVDSTNGFVLAAGEQIFIEIDNLATVYIDADNNDEGVYWIAS